MIVVLTREAGRNNEQRSWFTHDEDVREVPLTRTRLYGRDEVARQVAELEPRGGFVALVVSSARAVPFVDVVREALLADAQVLSVGPATTRALREEGVTVSAEARDRALDLSTFVTAGPVLLLGALETRDELSEDLRRRGIDVAKVACYETVPRQLSEGESATLSSADVVLIGAPSAWSVARAHVRTSTWVVVRGPTTGEVVRGDHERVLVGWGPELGVELRAL